MSLSCSSRSHAIGRWVLVAVLLAYPAAVHGDEDDDWVLSLAGGVPVQGGTLGDIYRPVGWMFGADLEGFGPGERPFYLGFDYFSVPPRKLGHVIAASKQMLIEARIARLVLYRAGVRRVHPGTGSLRRYAEIGFGLGAASAEYTTTADTTGEGGPVVGDLFVGAGMRARIRGPVGAFAGVRMDGVHAILRGQWGVIASARAGMTITAPISSLPWARSQSPTRPAPQAVLATARAGGSSATVGISTR